MRICLVSHGFPPHERTGVENYTAALARALVRAGHAVEVFAPRRAPELGNLCQRREFADGYGVTWLAANVEPATPAEALEPPGRAQAFARFLDREQPQVVHFQHVLKLGLGCLRAARERGMPVVYTAHDYYPVCHRVTWMRPDLERCTVLGDAVACARCDLALGFLNGREALGDYQVGVLPEQLAAPDRAQLAAILGAGAGEGTAPAELEQARARRSELDRLRADAFAQVDLVLAPTRFLGARLVDGGVASERVRVLGYGTETGDLADLAPARIEPGRPLRIAFLGGMSKHKGVHVLLDAFERLGRPAQLVLHGASSDAAYAELVRARAARLGVSCSGAYERSAVRAHLAAADVVVVPSIWVENQPLVIREAFAAHRPVVASRVGALPESVRDGVDGLLCEPGDAEDLARALRRLVDEPALHATLVRGITAPKSVDEQARELAACYGELLDAERARAHAELPPHLAPIAARHAQLSRTPTRELFALAMQGLPRLAGALGAPQEAPGPLLARAFAQGTRAQEELGDAQGERAWLRSVIEGEETGLSALRAEVRWQAQTLRALNEEVAWLRGLDAEFAKERAWLQSRIAAQEAELSWMRETAAGNTAEVEWRRTQLADLQREIAWLREVIEIAAAELASGGSAGALAHLDELLRVLPPPEQSETTDPLPERPKP